jgi:hypothetical protein
VYERFKAGSMGSHTIWAFKLTHRDCTTNGLLSAYFMGLGKDEFWNKIRLLLNMGLLQFVPHLMPNSGNDAEPLHPYGVIDAGEPIEQKLGASADLAGEAMLLGE